MMIQETDADEENSEMSTWLYFAQDYDLLITANEICKQAGLKPRKTKISINAFNKVIN